MVYQWSVPGLFPVSADTAKQELDRIYDERNKLEPEDIVDESRPEDAVLHDCFEWRDPVAAELWRKEQARGICRNIVVVQEIEERDPVQVRVIQHVQGSYHPMEVIIQEADKYSDLKQQALKELNAFRKRFSILSDWEVLKKVFPVIEEAIAV